MPDPIQSAVDIALGAVAAALPSLDRRMTVDGVTARAVLCSSVDVGAEAASTEGANETRRIVAKVSDFPDLTVDSPVDIDGSSHLVTSLRKSGEAAWFVGLSAALSETAAVFSLRRRAAGAARAQSFTVDALAVEADAPSSLGDPVAVYGGDEWRVVVRVADWPLVQPPDIGDDITFYAKDRSVSIAAARVVRRGGSFVITGRTR